jgi:hypothetical protein
MALSQSGHGIEVAIGDATGTPGNYVPIDGVTDATFPSIVKVEKKRRDVHRRTADPNYGAARWVISRVTDFGEITIKFDRNPEDPGQQALITAGKAKQRVFFRLLFPEDEGGGGFAFPALITDITLTSPQDNPMEHEAKLQVDGVPVDVVAP